MSYKEDIKSFLNTLGDTYLLYFVGRPKAKIGKKLKGTPFRERYENELLDLSRNLKEDYSRLLHEKERDIPYERISELFDRYLDKFKNLQERYRKKCEKIEKMKEERSKKKLEEEI